MWILKEWSTKKKKIKDNESTFTEGETIHAKHLVLLLLLLLLSCFSRVRLCATPWTAAHQAPLSTILAK